MSHSSLANSPDGTDNSNGTVVGELSLRPSENDTVSQPRAEVEVDEGPMSLCVARPDPAQPSLCRGNSMSSHDGRSCFSPSKPSIRVFFLEFHGSPFHEGISPPRLPTAPSFTLPVPWAAPTRSRGCKLNHLTERRYPSHLTDVFSIVSALRLVRCTLKCAGGVPHPPSNTERPGI